MPMRDHCRPSALRTAGPVVAAALALLAAACANEATDPAALEVGPGAGEAGDEDEVEDGGIGPQVGDHWHAAFGVHVCGEWLPHVAGFEGGSGIHTHSDGLIHVHPFSDIWTGARATLAVFLDGTDEIDVAEGRLDVGGRTYRDGDDCGGDPGTVRIARWPSVDSDEHEVVTDPGQLRFLADREVVTIAFLPEGAEVPMPPGAADALATVSPPPTDTGATPLTPEDLEELAHGIDPVDVSRDGFAFRPVLGEVWVPECPEGWVSQGLGDCLALGGPAIGPEAVEGADATEDRTGSWVVTLVLTDGGIDAFNDLAAICFEMAADCPTGRIAVVVEGTVISAPVVQTPEFERDQILISGQFTEAQAQRLAADLAG